jgi:hypothetical protein
MAKSDDVFGDDPDEAEFAETFGRHCDAIYDRISEYLDNEELDEAYATQLLIELTLRMRMTAYALETESPSVSGVKLDLDRLLRELETYIREAKKNADEYIRHVKEMRALAEELEEDEGE